MKWIGERNLTCIKDNTERVQDGAPGNLKDAEVFARFVCDFLALRVLVDGVRWPAWPGKGVVVSRVGG